jgi:ABC-type Zn uptake system ZnuABC Zn-binding protein ZnuA
MRAQRRGSRPRSGRQAAVIGRRWRARRPTAVVAVVILAVSLAGCVSTGTTPAPSGGPIRVVATTAVLADLARRAGGDLVTAQSLVPAGADPHTFSPRPSSLRTVSDADVILMNGLGLDDWVRPLIEEAKKTSTLVVELAPGLDGVTYLAGSPEGGSTTIATAAPGAPVNPHLWLNAGYASTYVTRIAEALSAVRPEDASAIANTSAAYRATLQALDASIRARIAAVPAANRRIVSFHDAFPYYAAAYGLDVVGVVVRAPGQEPNAGEVAALVDAIKASGTHAILAEAQFNPRIADRIAEETGATIVADLYTDTLGPAPADSYVGIMEWDTDRIVGALQ